MIHDFDEARLYGVRFYARRLRESIDARCECVDVFPRPRTLPGGPLATFAVKQLLYPLEVRRLRADVFHVLDQSHAHLVRSLPAIATVVTCHDLHSLAHGSRVRRFGFRRRVNAMRSAARVIADSARTASEAVLRVGVDQSRVVVIRPRVDRFFLEEPSPQELAAGASRLELPHEPFFLHVGNSLAYKNLERLIAAIAELGRMTGRRPPLLVKAGAPLTIRQRQQARRRSVRVHEVGEVGLPELRALYHLATGLLYPSLDEGFGWPVAEALACGLPVVASSVGALPEVAAGAALEVDPFDVAGIALAASRLIDDDELRRSLREGGRRRGAELASGDFGRDLLDVYDAVLEESRKR